MKSLAKINLTLDILGKRPDGYHQLSTVFQSISLADKISVLKKPDKQLTITSNCKSLPPAEENIMGKAVTTFYKYLEKPAPPLAFHLEKQIPICAGLGGGSGNGATILKYLNSLENEPFSPEKLREIGKTIGADIPFLLLGGTALGEGIGEILTPLTPMPSCHLLICKPDFSISTPALFQTYAKEKLQARPKTQHMISALEKEDLLEISSLFCNVFQELLPKEQNKKITAIINEMKNQGALGACLSGSGSAVFGGYAQENQAKNAFYALQQKYPETFLAHPV